MTYLIGTDEAGYGPNLGPLVISATVWHVPDGARSEDLYRLLDGVIVPTPPKASARQNGSPCAVMADSKVLYQSGRGLGLLERGLLAALALVDHRPCCCADLWDALAPGSAAARCAVPWYAGFDRPVPLENDRDELHTLTEALQAGLAAAGVGLVAVRSRAIFEEEFNWLMEHHESKGEALSYATLNLVAEVSQTLGQGPISIVCDKHGGRNSYGELLNRVFPEWLVEVYGEGRDQSLYRFGPPERRVEIRFQAKAESHLPAALASMASKYLRELAMAAFNDFWCRRVPGLCPTAGYPVDARRFKTAIAAVQAELGIEDRKLWRCK